jgi:hypothetical protein
MSAVSKRTKQYRDSLDVKWQRGIEQIILKYNSYIDFTHLIKYVSLDFIENHYYEYGLSQSIYNNVNITEEFLLKHAVSSANFNLVLYMFRKNKNISFAFWKENYHEFLNSYYTHPLYYKEKLSTILSQIASLTINDVLQNDWEWDFNELAKHPNIHVDDIIKHIHLFRSNIKSTTHIIPDATIYATVYENPTLQIKHILKLGTYHLTYKHLNKIAIHPNITEAIIKKYIREPLWAWFELLKNKNLSDEFILEYVYPRINFEWICHNFIIKSFGGAVEINKYIYNAFSMRQNIQFILKAPIYIHGCLCKLDFYINKFINSYPDLPWPVEYNIIHNCLTTMDFTKIGTYFVNYYKDSVTHRKAEYIDAIEYITKYINPEYIDMAPDIPIYEFNDRRYNTIFKNTNLTLELLLKKCKLLFKKWNKLIPIPESFIDAEYDKFIAKHKRRYIAARQIQRAWATAIYDPQYKLCHEVQYKRFTDACS